MYSEPKVDRVRLVFRFLLGRLSHLFPKGNGRCLGPAGQVVAVVYRRRAGFLGSFRIDERQANGNNFVRFAGCVWQVAKPNELVDGLRDA